jgi:hypothetical protein
MCPSLPALSQCGHKKYGFTSALILLLSAYIRVKETIFITNEVFILVTRQGGLGPRFLSKPGTVAKGRNKVNGLSTISRKP